MELLASPALSDPMSEAADSHQMAFVAARAFSASRRPAVGAALDDTDADALRFVADLLDSSGSVLEYFTSQGQKGQAPSEAVASRLDVTLDAVIHSHLADASLGAALTHIASAIRTFVDDPKQELGDQLAEFFSLLGKAAARRTATGGETVDAL